MALKVGTVPQGVEDASRGLSITRGSLACIWLVFALHTIPTLGRKFGHCWPAALVRLARLCDVGCQKATVVLLERPLLFPLLVSLCYR